MNQEELEEILAWIDMAIERRVIGDWLLSYTHYVARGAEPTIAAMNAAMGAGLTRGEEG